MDNSQNDRRGFAAMDEKARKEAARRGGEASHREGESRGRGRSESDETSSDNE